MQQRSIISGPGRLLGEIARLRVAQGQRMETVIRETTKEAIERDILDESEVNLNTGLPGKEKRF